MRRLGLMLGLLYIISACSNATFKGVTGSKARNDSAPPANTEDANPGGNPNTDNPPVPIPPGPGSENPNTQNPGQVPCDPMAAVSLSSLYQMNADPCHNHDPDDNGSDPDDDDDDDDMDDDDDDDPGQNNPGQNNY